MSTTETPPQAEPAEEHIQDATVVEPGQVVGQALMPATPAPVPATTDVNAGDLVKRLDTIKEAMEDAMQVDVDYGVIPGTQKPTLLKPGAEKLAVLFQLDVQITHDERYGPGDHLTVPAYCTIFHAVTGARLGRGEGLCTTRERKYAYRKQERKCPTCGVEAIIKGKPQFGGGWVCWKKRGGCDAKFAVGNHDIEGQEVGEIDNPDLPDLWNTVIKMARKRALVDAVLLVTGASALFTQDMEDQATAEATENGETSEAAPAAGPPYGPAATEAQVTNARNAIAYLLGKPDVAPDHNSIGAILNEIEQAAGVDRAGARREAYLPHFALAQVTRVAAAVRKRRETLGKMAERDETQPAPATTPKGESEQEKLDREYGERVAEQGS